MRVNGTNGERPDGMTEALHIDLLRRQVGELLEAVYEMMRERQRQCGGNGPSTTRGHFDGAHWQYGCETLWYPPADENTGTS